MKDIPKASWHPIHKLFFRYVILPQDSPLARSRLDSGIRDTTTWEVRTNIRLPATLDLNSWGQCNPIGDKVTLIYRDAYLISVVDSGMTRTGTVLANSGRDAVLSFTDKIISLQEDSFVRELDNGTIIQYSAGVQIKLTHKTKDSVFMEKLPQAKKHVHSPITLDLETQGQLAHWIRVI